MHQPKPNIVRIPPTPTASAGYTRLPQAGQGADMGLRDQYAQSMNSWSSLRGSSHLHFKEKQYITLHESWEFFECILLTSEDQMQTRTETAKIMPISIVIISLYVLIYVFSIDDQYFCLVRARRKFDQIFFKRPLEVLRRNVCDAVQVPHNHFSFLDTQGRRHFCSLLFISCQYCPQLYLCWFSEKMSSPVSHVEFKMNQMKLSANAESTGKENIAPVFKVPTKPSRPRAMSRKNASNHIIC